MSRDLRFRPFHGHGYEKGETFRVHSSCSLFMFKSKTTECVLPNKKNFLYADCMNFFFFGSLLHTDDLTARNRPLSFFSIPLF